MREAVGGSLLFYLIIPIIVLFIFFIGFIMNYASAYRAANYVVTQIENCQGQLKNCGSVNMTSITQNVKKEYGYVTPDRSNIKVCHKSNGKEGTYVFRVELPVSFELPIFGSLKPFTVKAETKTISNVPSSSMDSTLCRDWY